MGGVVSPSRRFRDPDCLHHAAQRAADRVQRSRPAGHHGRPRLEQWRLLWRKAPGARPGGGAHGGPHHVHERRLDAREVRPPPAREGDFRIRLRRGFRSRELPALPRQRVCHPLRRQLVPLHHQGHGLFRSHQRPRLAGGGVRTDRGALPGDQLQLRLAVPELPVAGDCKGAAGAQLRCGLRRARVQLRARRLPGGCRRADRSDPRFSRQHRGESAMSGQPARKQAFVRELLGRSDYAIIGDIVEPGARVLDLGCGEGELLEWLAQNKGVEARGVEISGAKVQRAIARGVSVYQGDIDQGLADYPDGAFDYVILRQTLQETHRPRKVLREMLRVGRRAIVAFPNFGHWRVRLSMLVSGRAPQTKLFPYEWYESPNIHFLTVHDFEALAALERLAVERRYFLAGRRKVTLFPNLLAEVAVFQVSGPEADR